MGELIVTSPAFASGGTIPVRHTGYGEDLSPELVLAGLDANAVSMAIVLDDLGLPIPAYNHWIIWNIPPMARVSEGIPQGRQVGTLGGARQGIGYGRHCYRGPKPPFQWSHEYRFQVYVLSAKLNLPAASKKRDLLRAMQGNILQMGSLVGHYT